MAVRHSKSAEHCTLNIYSFLRNQTGGIKIKTVECPACSSRLDISNAVPTDDGKTECGNCGKEFNAEKFEISYELPSDPQKKRSSTPAMLKKQPFAPRIAVILTVLN